MMLTLEDVRQIIKQLGDAMTSEDDLSGEVTCIVYRADLFDCGGKQIVNRHIDIEFAFGEVYELHEGEALFQSICALCDLPVSTTEEEVVMYQP